MIDGKPRYALNRWFWRCIACEHPVSALTASGVDDAMSEHYAYIHKTADQSVDPHFEEQRLDRLIAQ